MKHVALTIALFITGTFGLRAQGAELVFFTDDGARFIAHLDGRQLNDVPASRVKAENVMQEWARLRVVFEDPTRGEFTSNIGSQPGKEITYQIRLNNKGKYVTRFQSEAPLGTTPNPMQTTVHSGTTTSGGGSSQETITTTTTTNAGTTGGGGGIGINFNVNVDEGRGTTNGTMNGGTNSNVNVGVNDNMGGGGSINMNIGINDGFGTGVNTNTTTRVTQTTTTTTSGTTGTTTPAPARGCTVAMGATDFRSALESIRSKSFEDSKMTTAKQIAQSNCLNVNQVIQIIGLFTFEESKLDFAKFCYPTVLDPNNYFRVNDAFTFSASIDDLNAFIQANRR
jgi:hypothetical protein